jgi:hypothetical protein
MKKGVLFLSITFMAGVTFVNIYNSIVDARSWGQNIPESVQATRVYFSAVNPGTFFRFFSPVNQVLALLALFLFWKKSKKVKLFLAIAFLIAVFTDVFTFAYFYPRNNLLMTLSLSDINHLAEVISQWQFMNWVRSAILVIALLFSFLGLNEVYRHKSV